MYDLNFGVMWSAGLFRVWLTLAGLWLLPSMGHAQGLSADQLDPSLEGSKPGGTAQKWAGSLIALTNTVSTLSFDRSAEPFTTQPTPSSYPSSAKKLDSTPLHLS